MVESRGWLQNATLVVGAITLLRIFGLWFNQTDLYVDETQYWLWGQTLDFGYYSKPPLIAWVLRAVTELAQSDAPFWVRLPAPLFHMATALILGVLAKRLFGDRAGFWVAVSYVTLPLASLGSLLISTDTILAPFFALGLLFYFRLIETRRVRYAALAGAMVGVAFMAKYAAVYFLAGAGLAAIFVPAYRIRLGHAAVFLAAFLLVISPNILWNIANDLTTIEHTLDNADWVRADSKSTRFNPAGLAEFFFSQFAVFGPVLFGVLLFRYARPGRATAKGLVLFSAPIILIVCVQAFLSKAYANWAVTAYFSGILLAVPWLVEHKPKLLKISVGINGLIAVLLPVLTIFATGLNAPDGKPLLSRYLGRVDLSQQILGVAQDRGIDTVVGTDRGILADLFYVGRDGAIRIKALPPKGRARNFYQDNHPLRLSGDYPVLFISRNDAPPCSDRAIGPSQRLDTSAGAYFDYEIYVHPVEAGCFDATN